MPSWFSLVVALATFGAGVAQDWDVADRAITRLRPSAFSTLPAIVRAELNRRGCTIPQTFAATHPENVVEGRFTSPGQTDWAILCSVGRTSTILVFRGGSSVDVVELASYPDINFLQRIGNGGIGFSRLIDVADPKSIKDHYERYGGPKPPPLDHEGIDDIFVQKGSSVWYWYRARWLKLTGSE